MSTTLFFHGVRKKPCNFPPMKGLCKGQEGGSEEFWDQGGNKRTNILPASV